MVEWERLELVCASTRQPGTGGQLFCNRSNKRTPDPLVQLLPVQRTGSKASTMTAITWHSGPPPNIGWWRCNTIPEVEAWRWWDGERWSVKVFPNDDLDDVADCALCKDNTRGIKWCDYWPDGARVARNLAVQSTQELQWRRGPPPHVGWWRCQRIVPQIGYEGVWRWWDGLCWSIHCLRSDTSADVGRHALQPSAFGVDDIQWCDDWPEGARVARVKP